jgi:hypothetical protein
MSWISIEPEKSIYVEKIVYDNAQLIIISKAAKIGSIVGFLFGFKFNNFLVSHERR